MSGDEIVDVKGLTVDFLGGAKPLRAVAGVDLTLRRGETLALLGESGSGKSVTLRALMRLLPERKFEVPLLQWSYQDLSFSGTPVLPGRMRRLSGGQLVNETGLSFRQAVYVADDRIFDLGTIGSGATFLPEKGGGVDAEDLRKKWRDRWQRNSLPFDRNSSEDIKQFLATQGDATYPVFVGLAEAPVLGASLPAANFTHRQYVIVVVGTRGTP